MNLAPQLEFARSFVHRARRRVSKLWRDAGLRTEIKEDSTPVTCLDRVIEEDFRETVSRQFPADGVLGEEYGLAEGQSDYLWVIDPIDGTQSLVNGLPTFGTFLALLYRSSPVLGLIDVPVLRLSVSGALGAGAWNGDGQPVRISAGEPCGPADIIALGAPGCFIQGGDGDVLARLHKAFPYCRAYYDCFGHYFAAVGAIGGLVEMNVPIWDIAATEAIVKAAGGEVCVLRENETPQALRSAVCGRKEVVEALRRVIEQNPARR